MTRATTLRESTTPTTTHQRSTTSSTRRAIWSLATFVASMLVIVPLFAASTHADSHATRTPAPEGAQLYIIAPTDGATVSSPVKVQFGLSGMGVAPAGVENEKTGHHHLIIDSDLPPLTQPVPSDDKHRHFGGGQTEVEVELAPGTHTLQLLLADYRHVPHDPPIVSKKITITVK